MERKCPDEGKEVDGSFFAVPEPPDNDQCFIIQLLCTKRGGEEIAFLFFAHISF